MVATQTIDYVGTNITFSAAGADFLGATLVAPGDKTFLWVKNADAASRTVTVQATDKETFFTLVAPNIAVVVPAGQERLIGPLTVGLQRTSAFEFVSITFSSVTNVTVAAVALNSPPPDLP